MVWIWKGETIYLHMLGEVDRKVQVEVDRKVQGEGDRNYSYANCSR